MPEHNVPRSGESKDSFMSRCVRGGGTHDACVAAFDLANPPALSLEAITGLFFDSSGFQGTSSDKRFRKDMLHVGHYEHPSGKWKLDVTPAILDDLVAKFQAMKDNGVPVEVVVDHSDKADAVVGYLQDMFVEGDKLIGIHEFTNQRGLDLAQAVRNVSVLINPEFKDGNGREYGHAITHSAIVQQPVVPGQKEFEPIAASLGCKVFSFSAKQTPQGVDPMLEKLLKLLGLKAGDDMTEDKAMGLLDERLKADANSVAKVEKLEGQLVDLNTKLEASLKDEPPAEPPALAPEVQEVVAKAANTEIQQRVKESKLTPAAASLLMSNFVGEPGKRNAMALSLNGGGESQLDKVLAIIDKNDPVELGEKTKQQQMELSRVTPGEPESKSDTDEEIQRRANAVLPPKARKTA